MNVRAYKEKWTDKWVTPIAGKPEYSTKEDQFASFEATLNEQSNCNTIVEESLRRLASQNKYLNEKLLELGDTIKSQELVIQTLQQQVNFLESERNRAINWVPPPSPNKGNIAVYFIPGSEEFQTIIFEELSKLQLTNPITAASSFDKTAIFHIYVVSMTARLVDLIPSAWLKVMSQHQHSLIIAMRAGAKPTTFPTMIDETVNIPSGIFLGGPQEQKCAIQLIATPYSQSKPPQLHVCPQNVVNKTLLKDLVSTALGPLPPPEQVGGCILC